MCCQWYLQPSVTFSKYVKFGDDMPKRSSVMLNHASRQKNEMAVGDCIFAKSLSERENKSSMILITISISFCYSEK